MSYESYEVTYCPACQTGGKVLADRRLSRPGQVAAPGGNARRRQAVGRLVAPTSELLRRERAALCDTLEAVGPDAPTLCEGWDAADLAAHLVVRERDVRALPGIGVPDILGGRLGRLTRRLMDDVRAEGFEGTVERLRSGPPLLRAVGPLAPVDFVENVVHHEDLRRANGLPAVDDPGREAGVWRLLRLGGRVLALRARGVGLEVEGPDGQRCRLRRGEPAVVLTGSPIDVLLLLSGRGHAAEVATAGSTEALRRLEAAKLSL